MNYYKELIDNLMRLQNNQDTKINIHFLVSNPLKDFCNEINKSVNRHSFGFINMDVRQITVPHISLYTGYVKSQMDLENVFEKMHCYASKTKSFQIDPVKIFFKSRTATEPQYLFLNMLQNDFLSEQKNKVFEFLESDFKAVDWDMKKEIPHITVGCYKNVTKGAIDEIQKYHQFPTCIVKQVGISISGKRGVCLGHLKIFDLQA